jgi:hypothetical protein
MNKTCTRCGVVKPESDFKLNRYGAKTYRRNVCRECCKTSLVTHEHDEKPDGRVCKRCNVYKPITGFATNRLCLYGVEPVCKACKRLRRLAYIAEHPECVRRADLKYHYGLTIGEYHAMRVQQQGKCAICGASERRLVVDHHHATGQVRCLLCDLCNTMIGYAREDPAILLAGAAYPRAREAPAETPSRDLVYCR